MLYLLTIRTYAGIKVPSRWKVNPFYNKTLLNILKKDKTFVDYIATSEKKIDNNDIYLKTEQFIQSNNTERNNKIYKNKTIYSKPNQLDTTNIIYKPNKDSLKNQTTSSFIIKDVKENNLTNEKDNYLTGNKDFKASFLNTNNNFNKSNYTNINSNFKNFVDGENTLFNKEFLKTSNFNTTLKSINKNISNDNNLRTTFCSNPKTNILNNKNNTSLYDVSNKEVGRPKFFNSTLSMFNNRSKSNIANYILRNKKNFNNLKTGNFINVDYNSLNKKEIANIKDKELANKWKDVHYYGPNYTHCNSCFNKNMDFFENINPNDGLKIVKFLKTTRKFND